MLLTLTEGSSVVSRSGEPQDFSRPILYTETAANGAKIVYTVRVQPADQPVPELIASSADLVEAGQSIRPKGHSFGNVGPDARVVATGPTNLTTVLSTTLLESTLLRVEVPFTLVPGRYRVQVLNRSERRLSLDTPFSIQLYDYNKPFVTSVISPKSSYTPGESIALKTVKFSAAPARFIRFSLSAPIPVML